MSAIIYLVTNTLDGKQYVGFTTDLRARMWNHKSAWTGGHLHNAIRKYGWENFDFDVIFEHDDEDWTLKVMEPHFIAWYDTFNNGYNLTTGGEGSKRSGPCPSKGKKKHSEEQRRKWSEARSGERNIMYGKHHSEETRRKIAAQGTGIRLTNVVTEEVAEYPSFKWAARTIGGTDAGIAHALKHGTIYKKTWRVERL